MAGEKEGEIRRGTYVRTYVRRDGEQKKRRKIEKGEGDKRTWRQSDRDEAMKDEGENERKGQRESEGKT